MKRTVEVENVSEKERRAIELALKDDQTRALCIIIGNLLALSDDRARGRVLRWAIDRMSQ